MHFIKLGAIGSTNDYLKDLARESQLENYTVVTAETQTAGRGQRGAGWISEPGKNLTMSVFTRFEWNDSSRLFVLNAAVATGVVHALEKFGVPELRLKWPNDIMSGRKKIGGILIENNVRTANLVESVIGMGINVNQLGFEGLPNAGSMATATGSEFDKDEVALAVVVCLQKQLEKITASADQVWKEYDEKLFRKGKPTVFETPSGERFMGLISEAGRDGQLKIRLEDDSVLSFGIKEISMLY